MEQQEKNSTGQTEQQQNGLREPPKWYEGRNREVVIYYLIAVFFLEIIVGAAAFFYGVAHAEAIVEGGPRMANFPWVGWLCSATLAPVGLLLLFHLSGWFFSRSMHMTAGGTVRSDEAAIPKNVEQFYSVVSNAPVIVVLLGLLALGGALYFLDTALGTLRPYIPWILGSATFFLVVCYVSRLYFLARHKRMERDFEYRMHVFRETGIIIADRNTIQLAPGSLPTYPGALTQGNMKELPEETVPDTSGSSDTVPPEAAGNRNTESRNTETGTDDDIVDASVIRESPVPPEDKPHAARKDA